MDPGYDTRREWYRRTYWGRSTGCPWEVNGFDRFPSGIYRRFSSLIHRGGKIIDLGCGNGLLLKYLCENGMFPLVPYGIDFVKEPIEQAKREILPGFQNHFRLGNIIDYEFEDGPFDFILMNPHYVLEEDRDRLAHRCLEHLRDRGRLIFYSYPDAADEWDRLANLRSLHNRGLAVASSEEVMLAYVSKTQPSGNAPRTTPHPPPQQKRMAKTPSSIRYMGLDLSRALEPLMSRLSILELFFVLVGTRRVCSLSVPVQHLERIKAFCIEQGLFAFEGEFRLAPILDKAKGDYSNIGRMVRSTAPGALNADLYVSRDRDYARLARACRFNDRVFGSLMGYPSCCVEFYVDQFDRRCKRGNDYIVPSIRSLRDFSYLNNTALCYFDVSPVSHFACSPVCKGTAKQARKSLFALKEHSPRLCEDFERRLRSLVLYTEKSGIAYSPEYHRQGNTVYLIHSYAISGTEIDKLLRDHRVVVVESHDRFRIGDRVFSDECRVMFYV
jgi:2-polyprenyl-3-methyl-5-hydroxy-6-metoxy-1,4-benzoquinol methylase